MNALALILILGPLSGATPAESGVMDLLTEAFGPVDCGDAIGNGRLTASFSFTGRVASIHWPSPGYYDQITYSMKTGATDRLFVPEGHGLCWATRSQDGFEWEVMESIEEGMLHTAQAGRYAYPQAGDQPGRLAGGGRTGTPLFFIHGDRDILVARFRPESTPHPSRIYWFANFTPCTRLIPEAPVGDSTFDYANDFAVFTPDNGRTIVHFRPLDLRGADWDEARRLALLGGNAPEWQEFDEGVWIAQSPDTPPTAFQCGVSGTNSSAFRQVNSGILQKQTAAVGDCDSAFEFACNPTPEGEEIAPVTVFIAFGKTLGEAIQALDYARQSGYDTLLEEATLRHADNLNPTQNATNSSGQWLDVLLTCMDRETGALVRMPLASPPLHVDIPRHGVMGAYALSVAGRHERVRKRIDFYLNALRTESSPGRPAGSLPAALYTNGEEAAPHTILDVEAVGWVLWLCQHHSENLDSPQRSAFIETSWPKIELAAEFLASWADPRTGLPRTAFNPQTLRDDQSPGLAIHTFMGLDSALALAALKGQERPEWRKRMQELENVIRARYLDDDGFWHLERPERFWNIDLVPPSHPRWLPALQQSLKSLAIKETPPETASEILFGAAMLSPSHTAIRDEIRAILEEMRHVSAGSEENRHPFPPDSYMAALQYIVCEKSQVRLPETPAIFQIPSAGWAPQPP